MVIALAGSCSSPFQFFPAKIYVYSCPNPVGSTSVALQATAMLVARGDQGQPPTGVRRRLSAMEAGRVLPPLASGGAQIAHDAVGAAGVAGSAELAAEMHPLVVDEQPLLARVHLEQDVLHLLRRVS